MREKYKMPQFSSKKEFDVKKLCLFKDNDKKCNIALGREVC